jgi:hypothetical protein
MHDGLLPPFVGLATATDNRSPYATTVPELIIRFGTSRRRRELLAGLIAYRKRLRAFGLHDGLQWINGSFVEDSESLRGRPPSDIDVVTFASLGKARSTHEQVVEAFRANAGLFNNLSVKAAHGCDAYFVDTALPPDKLIASTGYWANLFGHQRDTCRWKGIVMVKLVDDHDAVDMLEVRDDSLLGSS